MNQGLAYTHSLPSKHETLGQRWFTVGPTVNQRWANVSCLLGIAHQIQPMPQYHFQKVEINIGFKMRLRDAYAFLVHVNICLLIKQIKPLQTNILAINKSRETDRVDNLQTKTCQKRNKQ